MHSGRGDVDFPASKHSVAGISRDGISTDVYRDAKADWGQGGPTTSAYDRQHFEYKSQEEVAGKIGQSYKAWNKERRDKHIPVTQEIHQEGSIRAREAYEAAKR
jgi:hypothetical protein